MNQINHSLPQSDLTWPCIELDEDAEPLSMLFKLVYERFSVLRHSRKGLNMTRSQ